MIAPFTRPVDEPIITPSEKLLFNCPMRNDRVRWAARHAFNPAAVVHEGKVHVLFRAEDDTGSYLSDYTSRIGLAVSKDGVSFDVMPEPVLYPADDHCRDFEWYGGCEDPRLVQDENDTFFIYYTMWPKEGASGQPITARIGVATSPDLVNWTKHGASFGAHDDVLHTWHKATAVVQKVDEKGTLRATRIDGKYWMYWGEDRLSIATSDDLIHWDPVRDDDGRPLEIISPRAGFFDSHYTEAGPAAVLTDTGIVVIYNGCNSTDPDRLSTVVDPRAYAPGQLITDPEDPTRMISRPDEPFIKPEMPYERTGQYPQGTIFTEGLVLFKDTWFLYYGAADSVVGVATAPYSN